MQTVPWPSPADEDDVDALIRRGLAASQDDDGELALRCFARAGERAPTDGTPWLLAGAELAAMGDVAAAESALAEAVRLAPGLAIARFQLGLLQFTSGRAAVAVSTWQPLHRLPATNALPHFVAGFAALGRDHVDEALRCFERGLSADTDNAPLSADIRRLIETLLRRRTADGHSDGSGASGGSRDHAAPSEADAGTRHVLLSAYRSVDEPH